MAARLSAALAVLAIMTVPAMAEETVLLHAAGSLRARADRGGKALSRPLASARCRRNSAHPVLLKDEIAAGAQAEVFASANMEHPQALAAPRSAAARWCCSRATGCARWCGPASRSTPATLLDRMLDPE